jgi:hypothetical protein
MRSFTSSIRVVGFLAIQLSTICFGQAAYSPASLPAVMTAADYTYTVRLPVGWQLAVNPMLEYGLVFGPQGESFAIGWETVYRDPKMLRSVLPGYQAILPPAQFELKRRLLASPMGPLDVVTMLLPQLAAGSIQNVHVRRAFPGPEDLGFRSMLIIYQFTFLPRGDWAFAAQANPVVRGMSQVPMQAAAFIVTFPLVDAFSWQFGYRILSAPDSVFRRNERTYAQILQSFQVKREGLERKIKSNVDMQKLADSMNQITQQMGDIWVSQLGAGSEPGGSGAPPSTTNSRPAASGPLCYGQNTCSGSDQYSYCCQTPGGDTVIQCVLKSKDLPPPGFPPDRCRKINY